MPNLFDGSPPFSLSSSDWSRLGWGLARAVVGVVATYVGATVLPTLKEHANSDIGLLIVAVLSAGLPVILSTIQKFLGDTRVTPLVLALGLVLVGSVPAMAGSHGFTGATAAVIDGTILQNLIKDPVMLAIVLLGASLFASKVLKLDLSKFVLPIITSLLKPPTTTPLPGPPGQPSPVPVVPLPADPNSTLLQLLLNLLLNSKASGDAATEAEVAALLQRLTKK